MTVTSAQLNPTKNDLVIGLVQRELQFAAKLLPYFTDYSSFAGKGVRSIRPPRYSSFTATNRVPGTPGTISALTANRDEILLDQNLYVSWVIDQADEIESAVQNQILFIQRASAAHGRAIDLQLIARLRAAAIDLGNAPLTYDLILAMNQELMEADAVMSDVAMFISPAQYTEMFKLPEFKSAEVYGQATLPSGVIGRVLGIPVVVHNGLLANEVYMAEKSGIGYAFQLAPNVAQLPDLDYGTTAVRTAVDQKFGCAALQIQEKGAPATKSPLIVGVFGA